MTLWPSNSIILLFCLVLIGSFVLALRYERWLLAWNFYKRGIISSIVGANMSEVSEEGKWPSRRKQPWWRLMRRTETTGLQPRWHSDLVKWDNQERNLQSSKQMHISTLSVNLDKISSIFIINVDTRWRPEHQSNHNVWLRVLICLGKCLEWFSLLNIKHLFVVLMK